MRAVTVAVDRCHDGARRVDGEVAKGGDAAREVGTVGDARVDDRHADAVAVLVGHARRRRVVGDDAHGRLQRRLRRRDLLAEDVRVFRDRQHVGMFGQPCCLAGRHLQRERVDDAVLVLEAGAVRGQQRLRDAALAGLDAHDDRDQGIRLLAQRAAHLVVDLLRLREGGRPHRDEGGQQDGRGPARRHRCRRGTVSPDRFGALTPGDLVASHETRRLG